MDVDVVNADVVELCVCTEKRFARGTSIWGGRVGRYCTPIDVEASNGADGGSGSPDWQSTGGIFVSSG